MATELLNITINQDDIEKAISNAAKARTELDKLKAANKQLEKQKKDLAKAEGDNTQAIEQLNKQIAKNNTQIKTASATVRENEKIVVANTQAQQANEGSITQLRRQLGIVSQQWANLSKNERENTEEGKRLAKQKLELTELLKAEEKATGDTRRNVGNYTESVKEALEASGNFGKGLVGMVSGLRAATAASLKFLATPLGAVLGAVGLAIAGVVGAFKTLRASLERTEKGQAALSRIFSSFRGLVNGVLKAVEPLAEVLADGLAIGFDLVTDAILKANKAIANALEFLGLDDWAEGLRKVNQEIEDTTKKSNQLADAQTRINELQREEGKLQLEFQRRAEIQRQIRDDESKSIEERIEANRRLGQILDEQSQQELAFAEEQLKFAKLRAEVNGEDETNLNAIADAELKILEIQERITSQRSEQLVNINSLIKEQTELEEEAAEKALEAQQAAIKQREEAEEAARQAKLEREAELQEIIEQEELIRIENEKARLAEQRAEGLLSKQEYEEALVQIELDTIQKAREAAELARQEALNSTELTELEKRRIILESEQIIADARQKTAELSIAAQEKTTDVVEKTEEAKLGASLETANEIAKTAGDLAGENTALAKASGIAQATIQTFISANAATAPPPVGAGPIAGIPLAALTVAKGLANVAKIAGIGFADGGFTGSGYGSPDSSGYKPAGIVHEGEYVIKKSMVENPNFAPIVSFLENSRLRGYADGGMVGRTASLPAIEGSQASQLQASITELRNIQPIVKVTDINRVSGQAQMVRVSGEL